jgi:hypothetical protein
MADQGSVEELAPYPRREEDVTADGLARHLTTQCQWLLGRMDDGLHEVSRTTDRDRRADKHVVWSFTAQSFVAMWAVVHLLRELSPAEGDRLARSIWRAWNDGAHLEETVWEWLTEWGIDPARLRDAGLLFIDKRREAAAQEPDQSLKDQGRGDGSCGEVGTSWLPRHSRPVCTAPCTLPPSHDEDHDWAQHEKAVWDGAYQAGYAEAVARLRDDTRYLAWWSSSDQPDGTARQHLADYLEVTGPDGYDVQRPGERREAESGYLGG